MPDVDPNLIHAEQELASAREQGDRFGEFLAFSRLASIFSNMAETSSKERQPEESEQYWLRAIDYFQQAKVVASELSDEMRESGMQIEIEHAQWRLQGGESSTYYQHALTVARQTGDRKRERRLLGIVGFK